MILILTNFTFKFSLEILRKIQTHPKTRQIYEIRLSELNLIY